MIYHEKDKNLGKRVTCYLCGFPGGTLVKDDKGYHHLNQVKCRMLQLSRRKPDGRP